jgi:uncharacterized membrane protein
MAWDISEDGRAVGGRSPADKPVVWTAATPAGARTQVALPDAGFGGAVRAIASDGAGAPVVMTGNIFVNGSNKRPARWTPCIPSADCPSGWSLTTVELVAPVTGAWGQDINPSGMIVGMEGSGCCRAVFWSADGAQSILQPISAGAASAAWGINDAGTVIVGQSAGVAVMWVRGSTIDDFAQVLPVRLEPVGATCRGGASSIGYALNGDFVASGTIVGQACGLPVAWKVDLAASPTSIEKLVLPSTGRSTGGVARAINRSTGAPHRVTGQVNATGVYWIGF